MPNSTDGRKDSTLPPLIKWINPQHLLTANLAGLHRQLEASPQSMVAIDNFLLPAVAERIALFLRKEAEYERIYQSRSKQYLNREEWDALPEEERFYRFLTIKRVRPECRMSPNWLTFLGFNDMLKHASCSSFMEAISGLQFMDARIAGIHGHEVDDMIAWHADAGRNKDFCGVLYLSPDWLEEDGGELELRREGMENLLLYPAFNRLVLFKTDKQTVHRVRPHAPSAINKVRYSYVFWYKLAEVSTQCAM